MSVLLSEVMKGAGDVGEVRYERTIEVAEPNKQAHPLDGSQGLSLVDGSECCRVHGDMSLLDDHPKVFDLGYRKGTLLKLQVQVVVLKSLENLLHPFLVFDCSGRVDKEVIYVDDEPSFCGDHAFLPRWIYTGDITTC
jgi:hypothetical protein